MIRETEKAGTRVLAPKPEGTAEILTEGALEFVAELHRAFNPRRLQLLEDRIRRQNELDRGVLPDFLTETEDVRSADWRVGAIPDDLQDRRTEITGPVDRKMVINALNSGARVFMADFEDANSPTWVNCIEGQLNLYDAVRRQIEYTAPNGKQYRLAESTATLMVRPRGWHLPEKHVEVDGEAICASLFDFGLYFYHNAHELLSTGSGPYFYLPKLENHLEARLWNDVFKAAQDLLGLAKGTIKATVLVETITASFEMEEILFELKDHIAGMNAGRWDYIFSIIKKFRNHPQFILPDRGQVTMKVPFMRAYAELLVKICHKRGAHAIGGMSAFIPSRNKEANRTAFEKVRDDKRTEADQGYDGTWVAHPFLVPVAMEEFNKVLGVASHQKHIMRDDLQVEGSDLLNVKINDGRITEEGLRQNINVGILYIESWLQGTGAAALYDLMEDAATAEISRAQVWQWVHSKTARLDDGRMIDLQLYEKLFEEELTKAGSLLGSDRVAAGKLQLASRLFDNLVRAREFAEFLTLDAYEIL